MICVVPEPMVAAVETLPPLLAAFAPACVYVKVLLVPTPVLVNTPLNDVFVPPETATICPVVTVAVVAVVTVTTPLVREMELIVNVDGLAPMPLSGIVNVAGNATTFAVFGVMLKVV